MEARRAPALCACMLNIPAPSSIHRQDSVEYVELLFDGHFVIDLLDAFHRAGNFYCLVDLCLVAHKTTQQNFALPGFDADIRTFDVGVCQQGRLHFGANDAVVNRGSRGRTRPS